MTQLGFLDIAVFIVYIVATVVFALWMGSRQRGAKTADGYFKADKQLPWYVVGASIISAGVSSEQFIGTVGIAYLYGMAVANYQWGAIITYSILIFIFLPFYMRGNVTTMPEFLERRFNTACRHIYALISLISMAFVLLGVTMWAGGKALNVLFPDQISVTLGIFILALSAGIYSIYGGLLSSVWADLVQYVVLMSGGILVAIYALNLTGGIGPLLDAMPEKAIIIYDSQHEAFPWFGLLTTLLSLGVWYNCANQVIVQRFLGSRSEWDARMGVIMAGFSMAIFPLLIVIPGIAAFYLFHDQLSDGDRSWAYLVQQLLPSGVVGIVLAGLASSVLGTLAAVMNSASTIFTYDIYKPIINKNATDPQLFKTGRISAAIVMVIGIITAILYQNLGGSIFIRIQTAFSYLAAPIAAIFIVGILWKRATAAAATWALVLGFISLPFVVLYLFPKTGLAPYDSFPHHTFVVFALSILITIVFSFFTTPKPAAQLKDVTWDKSALKVPEAEKPLNRGYRDFRLWWTLMMFVIISMYVMTYTRANQTLWLEAEIQPHTTTAGAIAAPQSRTEAAATGTDFNLWTGKSNRQLLFTGTGTGDEITFDLPIKEAAEYRVAVVITKGPDYGAFSARVNDSPATISHNITTHGDAPRSFVVTPHETQTFDANTSNTEPLLGEAPGRTVIDRLELGIHNLSPEQNKLTFRLEPGALDAPHIGIDQIMITPVKEN